VVSIRGNKEEGIIDSIRGNKEEGIIDSV